MADKPEPLPLDYRRPPRPLPPLPSPPLEVQWIVLPFAAGGEVFVLADGSLVPGIDSHIPPWWGYGALLVPLVLAGGLGIGATLWQSIARRRWKVELVGRSWLATALAGLLDLIVFACVMSCVHYRPSGHWAFSSYGLAWIAAVSFEVPARLAWAIALTRRRPAANTGNEL